MSTIKTTDESFIYEVFCDLNVIRHWIRNLTFPIYGCVYNRSIIKTTDDVFLYGRSSYLDWLWGGWRSSHVHCPPAIQGSCFLSWLNACLMTHWSKQTISSLLTLFVYISTELLIYWFLDSKCTDYVIVYLLSVEGSFTTGLIIVYNRLFSSYHQERVSKSDKATKIVYKHLSTVEDSSPQQQCLSMYVYTYVCTHVCTNIFI